MELSKLAALLKPYFPGGGGSGSGDVTGPAGATDGNLAVFNGTTGKIIKDGGTVPVGTVTSIALSAPTGFTVSGSPITGSGTLTLAYAAWPANKALMGPTSGADATPTIRAFVADDIPTLTPAKVGLDGLATSISVGKTLTLASTNDFTATFPATGTVALLERAQSFTADQNINAKLTVARAADTSQNVSIWQDGTGGFLHNLSKKSNKKHLMIENLYHDDGGADLGYSDIYFKVGEDASPIEALNIDYRGYIGMGTASPATPLHIANGSSGQLLTLEDSGATSVNDALVYMAFKGYSTNLGYFGYNSAANSNLVFMNYQNAELDLGTNSAVKLRILGDGRARVHSSLDVGGDGGGTSGYITFTNVTRAPAPIAVTANVKIYLGTTAAWFAVG